MDKVIDYANHNILTSGGPSGTSGAHTTNTGAHSQYSSEYLARLQEFVLHWSILPIVVPRGPGFTRNV